jgi:hypothetical protein
MGHLHTIKRAVRRNPEAFLYRTWPHNFLRAKSVVFARRSALVNNSSYNHLKSKHEPRCHLLPSPHHRSLLWDRRPPDAKPSFASSVSHHTIPARCNATTRGGIVGSRAPRDYR